MDGLWSKAHRRFRGGRRHVARRGEQHFLLFFFCTHNPQLCTTFSCACSHNTTAPQARSGPKSAHTQKQDNMRLGVNDDASYGSAFVFRHRAKRRRNQKARENEVSWFMGRLMGGERERRVGDERSLVYISGSHISSIALHARFFRLPSSVAEFSWSLEASRCVSFLVYFLHSGFD